MKLRLTIGKTVLTANLVDNATTSDLVSLLPITLTLEDHGGTEKIAYPPRKLSTRGAPASSTPRADDFAYYAPWGNLALFHQDFSTSPGLIILGRLDGDLEILRRPGKLRVTLEVSGEGTP